MSKELQIQVRDSYFQGRWNTVHRYVPASNHNRFVAFQERRLLARANPFNSFRVVEIREIREEK